MAHQSHEADGAWRSLIRHGASVSVSSDHSSLMRPSQNFSEFPELGPGKSGADLRELLI